MGGAEMKTEPASPGGGRRRRAWLPWSVAAAAIAAAVWAEWTGWPFLREPVAHRLAAALHRGVQIEGAFALRLVGTRIRLSAGRVVVQQPVWLRPRGGDIAPMLVLQDVHLQLPYRLMAGLLGRRPLEGLSAGSIEIGALDGQLVRTAEGQANWSLAANGRAPPRPPGSPPATLPRVDKLVVHQGRLQLSDALMRLDVDAQLSTAEGEEDRTAPGLKLEGAGHFRSHPFDMRLSSVGALPLLAQRRPLQPAPITIHARAGGATLNFEGSSADVLALDGLAGRLTLAGPSLAAVGDAMGMTLPTTAAFAMAGELTKNGQVWELDMQSLHVGSSRLSGHFVFDRRGSVPRMQGEVDGSRVALVDLAPAFGAPTGGAPNPAPPRGRVLPQRRFDVPSLRAMDADVRLTMHEVVLGALFAQPLMPLNANLRLQSGVLRLTDLDARTAGGSMQGAIEIDGRGDSLRWSADLSWAGIELSRWLSAPDRHAMPGPGARPASYVSGRLAGRARLKGRGTSTAELLATLDGRAQTWVEQGRISRLLVEAAGLRFPEIVGLLIVGDEPEPMQCAAARLSARRGAVTPDVAIIDTAAATLLVSGSVSLAREQLNLKVISKPKSLSLVSLRTPIEVRGSFAAPRAMLSANPLGAKVLAAAALAGVAPLAALVPLIDVGQHHAGGCAAALQRLDGGVGYLRPGTSFAASFGEPAGIDAGRLE